uniref:Uncharacterized protein n=1 Tax=Clytia hemisphaerica TaxID=252671 RepID=A0A7M5X285_9CNID
MRMTEDEIDIPDGNGWPKLLYIYKPNVVLKEKREPEEITLEDTIDDMTDRIASLEKKVKTLKKLNEEVNELKKNIPKPQNLSKHKFRQLSRDNNCQDSITYSEACYEKWKKSGGGSFFVPPSNDKPSTSHSKDHDGWVDSSYHHSYNDHHGYYGN